MSEKPDVIGLEGRVVELADGSELEFMFTPRRLRAVEAQYQSLDNYMAALRAQPFHNIAWTIALHQRGGPPGGRLVDEAIDLIAVRRSRDYLRAIVDALTDGLGGNDPVTEFHLALNGVAAVLPRFEDDATVTWIRRTIEELRAAMPLPPQPAAPRNGSHGVATSISPSPSSTSTPGPSGTA